MERITSSSFSFALPEELTLYSFTFLSDKINALVIPLVCKSWKRISEDNSLWAEFFQRRFQEELPDPSKERFLCYSLSSFKLPKTKPQILNIAPSLQENFQVIENKPLASSFSLFSGPYILKGDLKTDVLSKQEHAEKKTTHFCISKNNGTTYYKCISYELEDKSFSMISPWFYESKTHYHSLHSSLNLFSNVLIENTHLVVWGFDKVAHFLEVFDLKNLDKPAKKITINFCKNQDLRFIGLRVNEAFFSQISYFSIPAPPHCPLTSPHYAFLRSYHLLLFKISLITEERVELYSEHFQAGRALHDLHLCCDIALIGDFLNAKTQFKSLKNTKTSFFSELLNSQYNVEQGVETVFRNFLVSKESTLMRPLITILDLEEEFTGNIRNHILTKKNDKMFLRNPYTKI